MADKPAATTGSPPPQPARIPAKKRAEFAEGRDGDLAYKKHRDAVTKRRAERSAWNKQYASPEKRKKMADASKPFQEIMADMKKQAQSEEYEKSQK